MTRNAMWKNYSSATKALRDAFTPFGSGGIEDTATKVIGALRGMGADAWIELDERSGYRDLGSALFSVVRQTRNSPTWGPRLFAAINEPKTLTQAWVRDQVRALGLTFNRTSTGDYRVRIKGSPASHGYHTDDLRDALDTARAMASAAEAEAQERAAAAAAKKAH